MTTAICGMPAARQRRLVVEDPAEMLPVGKHLGLRRQIGAAGIDEVDARQAVLAARSPAHAGASSRSSESTCRPSPSRRWQTITHSRPETRPMPVIEPARRRCCRHTCHRRRAATARGTACRDRAARDALARQQLAASNVSRPGRLAAAELDRRALGSSPRRAQRGRLRSSPCDDGGRIACDPMTIHYDADGPVAVVTIDRPEVANAVDRPTAEALADAFRRFDGRRRRSPSPCSPGPTARSAPAPT